MFHLSSLCSLTRLDPFLIFIISSITSLPFLVCPCGRTISKPPVCLHEGGYGWFPGSQFLLNHTKFRASGTNLILFWLLSAWICIGFLLKLWFPLLSDPPSLTVNVKDGNLNASYCLTFFPSNILLCITYVFYFCCFLSISDIWWGWLLYLTI